MGTAVSVCPAALVLAPLERVWGVLMDSEHYGKWADAHFTRFDPPGRAVPGQVMEADAQELGLSFRVRLRIESIDHAKHQLAFDVELPFGLREKTTITCTAIDEGTTRVQYGWDFTFPPGWRGRLVELLVGQRLEPGVEDSLRRLKAFAEAG